MKYLSIFIFFSLASCVAPFGNKTSIDANFHPGVPPVAPPAVNPAPTVLPFTTLTGVKVSPGGVSAAGQALAISANLTKLRPVSYHWKEGADTDLHYGLIAQETEKVVSEMKKGKVADPANVIVAHDKKTDRYGIKYTELISPVIKAIQELYHKLVGVEEHQATQDRDIASLKAENADLKAKAARAEQENAAIKSYLCAKDPKAPMCK